MTPKSNLNISGRAHNQASLPMNSAQLVQFPLGQL
jgi:hypothetical protein